MKTGKVKNALRANRIRCVSATVTCILLCLFAFWGVTLRILDPPSVILPETGLQSFRMFTVLSNILTGIASALCIPYAMDGMRYRNYHLPMWVVCVLYAATTCLALTFLTAITALSAVEGFSEMMLHHSNLYMHTICPLLAILLLTFINTDHTIDLKSNFIATAPMLCYGLLYIVLVYVLGEEDGGWRDIYHFKNIMPWYLLTPLVYLITFAIAFVLRVIHNAVHRRRKAGLEHYYQEAEEFSYPDIREAVKALAANDRTRDKGGEVVVPRRIIKMMEKKYQSGLPLHELGCIYLREYMSENQEEADV